MKIKTPHLSIFLVFLTLLISAIILYAGAVIIDFRGTPGTNKVTLQWSTLSEIDCKGFDIERGLNKNDFKKIGFIDGAGDSSEKNDYEFVDNNVYKSTVNRTFYYRLIIVNANNSKSTYNQIVSVTPSISGARYTWGSIKALFR